MHGWLHALVHAKAAVDPMNEALTQPDDEANKDWLTRGERGALLGIRTVFWFATLFGRWPAKQFVWLISSYYAFTDRKAQDASRDLAATRAGARAQTARDP